MRALPLALLALGLALAGCTTETDGVDENADDGAATELSDDIVVTEGDQPSEAEDTDANTTAETNTTEE